MIINLRNVLTNKKRKQLIEDCQPFLYDSDQIKRMHDSIKYFPGKQTLPNLHGKTKFKDIIDRFTNLSVKKYGFDLQPEKCWINWTNGKKENISWHTHPTDYALVYYIQTPFFSGGTLFRERFIKAPQNSMLVFPAALEHSAPRALFPCDRYTLALNLNIVR